MSKEQDYWFKAKRYGWGWGLPQKPQGWIAYGVFFTIWLAALYWISSTNPIEEPSSQEYAALATVLILDVAGLLYFALKYGEPPKWRWGDKKRATKSKSD